jgi:hypothetical protein
MKPHRNAVVIKAFVDGIECEWFDVNNKEWYLIRDLKEFYWSDVVRIKPEPKEDIEETVLASYGVDGLVIFNRAIPRNLKITFDGETGELKSAEVIK